ncbi:MAG: response regulator [Bacteroidetes bacterium]|nr:MAG: response regulator [Bacteroidota bacterium]
MDNTAKILVVDDEPDLELLIRQRFRHRIRNNELYFEFAGNGVEAMKMLTNDPDKFDMILTDINMPEMDGLTLLIRIKEQFKHYKAVVVSAYGDLENIRTAMNRGAFDFVTKPIDFTDLETTINKTIDEYKIIRQGQIAKDQLDITIRQKERAELEKLKAEQSEKFKQQFLANMSHEIRTPMNSVIGLTNLLMKSKMDQQQTKYLNVIKKSSENLLVIINDILDLSKIEAGKMDFEKIAFSLHDCLDTVYHTMVFKSEEKSLELKQIIDEKVPEVVIGDPVRLNQILINLAGNAIKFTEKGSVTIQIKELNRHDNISILEFSITDTGIGIAQSQLDKIFESFSQASSDTTRKFGGTGLGLTISKQLVELQNGSIYVQSQPGQGTTFSFKIPYPIGNITDLNKPGSGIGDVLGEDLKGIRILLVEDNGFNQMVAVDTLNDLIPELTVDIAENGIESLEKLRSADYDIILMDIQMPQMDGFEATERIRTDFKSPKNQVPIMAMTANVTQEEVEKCFNCGMTAHISKPFDPQELLNKLGQLVLKSTN